MTKKQLLLQQLISAVLFIAVLGMLGWLSTRFKMELDWTAGHRNTLTEASEKQLENLKDPIKFSVFIYPRSELRQSLEADIRRYQRVKPDITVEFIDPSTHPQAVKDYNISHAGEVVVEYQGRHENLTATTEQAITAALQRLAYSGERWVVFLEGHGEHSINDTEQNGYAQYAQMLKDKGLKVRGLNLVTDHRVPDNTAVLVVASPSRPLLEGEAKLITQYVENGGNLLWLEDPVADKGPDPAASLGAIAKLLDISWLKGTGILLESADLGLPPFVYITTQYPANPVTDGFGENALFPLVRGLSYKSSAGAPPAPGAWNAQPLLTTSEQAWLETGRLEGNLDVNEAQGDTKGPLTLGVTLQRDAKATADAKSIPQRVAVIGDSDFISNAYFGQLGNSLLGLNLAQWLASRDEQLNIDIPKAPDRSLTLPAWGLYSIYFGFAFLLPAGLLTFGVARWVIRRRK
jgi:ABC-type uncharacterized transport system involved in gliding motility auxiliary subunit